MTVKRLIRTMRIDWKCRLLQQEEGAELVEFAISTLVLISLLIGLTFLCMIFFAFNSAAEASRNTARWLSVNGTASCAANNSTCIPTAAQINAHVQSLAGAAKMSATVRYCTNPAACSSGTPASAGNLVQVQVSYTYARVPFISTSPLTVTSTSQLAIWQ